MNDEQILMIMVAILRAETDRVNTIDELIKEARDIMAKIMQGRRTSL